MVVTNQVVLLQMGEVSKTAVVWQLSANSYLDDENTKIRLKGGREKESLKQYSLAVFDQGSVHVLSCDFLVKRVSDTRGEMSFGTRIEEVALQEVQKAHNSTTCSQFWPTPVSTSSRWWT